MAAGHSGPSDSLIGTHRIFIECLERADWAPLMSAGLCRSEQSWDDAGTNAHVRADRFTELIRPAPILFPGRHKSAEG